MNNKNQKEKDKELFHHLMDKNFTEAKRVIKIGANIESPYTNAAAIIASNVITSDFESYKQLLALGTNANVKDGYGRTALFEITSRCDEPSLEIEKFLSLGGNINACTHSGRTALFEAVGLSLNKVKALIENGIDVNAQDENGATALIESISSAPDKTIIEYLLSHDANPNIVDDNSESSLHYLAKLNYNGQEYLSNISNILQLLLKYKADIHIKNNEGKTALQLTNNLAVAKILVKNGADLNAQYIDNQGKVCSLTGNLFAEISKGKISQDKQDLLFFLFENGADLSQKIQGKTIISVLYNYIKPYSRSPIDKNRIKKVIASVSQPNTN